MQTIWTSNLSDLKDKEDFKKRVYSSKDVLDRQKAILEQELRTLERSEVSLRTYDTPNWDVKQAHMNGDRARIMWMLQLINLDKERK